MLSRFIRPNLLARRLIVTGQLLRNESQPPKSINKEVLMELRKKTGYSYANCRKALLQFGENNLSEAENWLKETARKEGWAKAEKLSNRQASQGLVGVLAKDNVAALLEVNCETDFVARSTDFRELIEELAQTILDYGKKFSDSKAPRSTDEFVSIPLESSTKTIKGRSVEEAVALAVGQLRENIVIKKAEAIISNPNVIISAHTHPHFGTENVEMGQFASIVGITRKESDNKFPTEKLSQQICHHIIGMRPETLGKPPTDEEKTRLESLDDKHCQGEKQIDELNDFADVQSTQLDEDETQLLRQSFMFNPAVTVHKYLESHSAKLSWYVRAEIGEGQP